MPKRKEIMSRKKVLLIIASLLVGAATLTCLVRFFMVPPNKGNEVLVEGLSWIAVAIAISLFIAVIAHVDLYLRWMSGKGLALCFCWIVALILVFSGLANAERLPKQKLLQENGEVPAFMRIPYDTVAEWVAEAPYPAKALYSLLLAVVFLITIPCVFIVWVGCLFGDALIRIHPLLEGDPTARLLEDFAYSFLLAVLLRWTAVPIFSLLGRFFFPATMVVAHDLAFFMPRKTAENLNRGDTVQIRVWSGAPALIAILAGGIAVILHFRPWER